MMSLASIQEASAEAARNAAQEGMTPYVIWDQEELDRMPPFPFPMLGDPGEYTPSGWRCVDWLFCDSSGFGQGWEPALTAGQLIDKLGELMVEASARGVTVGFGIIEGGQFQVYVGVYERDRRRNGASA